MMGGSMGSTSYGWMMGGAAVWFLGDPTSAGLPAMRLLPALGHALAIAAGLGSASSSCSYAAVALARSLFRKGASFTAAMTFEIASTNPAFSSWSERRSSAIS